MLGLPSGSGFTTPEGTSMSAFLQAQCTLPPDEPKERMRKCTTTPHIAKDGSDLLASSRLSVVADGVARGTAVGGTRAFVGDPGHKRFHPLTPWSHAAVARS